MTLPSGPPVRVAVLDVRGGFVPLGFNEVTAARLVVYSDATAIADARHVLNIGAEHAGSVVAQLRQLLAGLPASAAPSNKDTAVMDAPTTRLEVLGADGHRLSVSAYAVTELDYDRRVVDAHGVMDRLAQRVRDTGSPYTGSRVRVVAVPAPDSQTVQSWPAGVPVPPAAKTGDPGAGAGDLRTADLGGPAAQALIAALPQAADPAQRWPILRTTDAGNLAVAWRHLLPDE